MPIVQTPVVTGTAISNTELHGNLDNIEGYLKGAVPGADIAGKVPAHARTEESNILHFTKAPFEIGVPSNWDTRGEEMDHTNPIDAESIIDFGAYGRTRPYIAMNQGVVTPQAQQVHPDVVQEWEPNEFQAKFLFERLGNIPGLIAGTKNNQNLMWSWNNWRFNLTAPNPAWPKGISGRDYAAAVFTRFPQDELWDTWKTVPHASMKIYVPEQCQLFVDAHARGTWNTVLQGIGPVVKRWSDLDLDNDPPIAFRLFIDQAHDVNSRVFEWDSNGDTYQANWAPIQPEREVGLGLRNGVMETVGREWRSSTWPRAVVRCASEINVPKAGYYNISLRYNSQYFYGYYRQTGDNQGWQFGKFAPYPMPTGPDSSASGPPWVARFEASGIQAFAQLGRTGQTDTDQDAQFT